MRALPFAKLLKRSGSIPFQQSRWLDCVVSTYLCGAFDCLLLSCHVRVSKLIHNLQLTECERTPCAKQGSSIIWLVWLNGWVFVYELSACGFESHCSHLNFRYLACFKQEEFLDIQATIECGFTLKRGRDMIRTCNQMHCTDKYSRHSSINWPIWLNGWVFVYKLVAWMWRNSFLTTGAISEV